MRISKINLLVLLSLFMSIVCYAQDYCNSAFVKSWELDRDRAVKKLILLWLENAPQQKLNDQILTITRKEIHMSSCASVFDINDFYLLNIDKTDAKAVPPGILKSYLKRNGIELDAKTYFEGKEFQVKLKEGSVL
ncbi:MAG: hypothetical protein AMJ42_00905 [Deltaproteobacteria bacterium DG_8]|nr:MAG: hypothetical protein AMJ42_00905 [Deltaproteobacteria bacterium DG_8]